MANTRTEGFSGRLLETLRTGAGTGKVWVAFSGGADSTALLAALTEIRDDLKRPLAAVHVHHGVHPQAEAWAQHCQSLCQALNIPLEILRVTPRPDSGGGPEAALREARYAAFETLLSPGEWLLTAHHRQDQAETLLLNLLRGCGRAGLAGMPVSRPLGAGTLLRPLLNEDRAELLEVLQHHGLTWIEDPSNQDGRLDRNYLRHDILPRIEARWPAAVRTFAQGAAQAREDAQLLDAAGAALLQGQLEDPGVLRIDEAWRADAARFRLALRHWLRSTGCAAPPRARLEEFCRQAVNARHDAATQMAWAGHQMHYWQDRLWLQDGALPPCPGGDWDGSTAAELGPALGRLELRGAAASLPWTLRIAARTGGERLPHADGRHRAVKELLRRAGVPPWLRDCVPLLKHGEETLAVGDWMIAPQLRACLQASEQRLCWSPRHPALLRLHSSCHRQPVETAVGLG